MLKIEIKQLFPAPLYAYIFIFRFLYIYIYFTVICILKAYYLFI